VVGVFLWFAAALTLLKILGMGDIAASLGTAAGFVALGVSYALSSMIADTVAGVYLLRDPDFNSGDRVTADGTTGVVRDIGLRKSRLELDDGDIVVVANSAVEKKWTLESDASATAADPAQ
jgi:small-conductance mechanosensitive channel